MPVYDLLCENCGNERKDIRCRYEDLVFQFCPCGTPMIVDVRSLSFTANWQCDTGTVSSGKECNK
jgi:hypothetical protein